MIAAALRLAGLGLAVFPTGPDCKRPVNRHGCHGATTDSADIERLWREYPGGNLAVATGAASGAFVLDVDVKSGADGLATLAALEARHGNLPTTWTTATPSGGRHFWFVQPERRFKNKVGFAPGLDVRTDGGSVAVPPSQRPDGRAYRWLRAPWTCEPAPAPDWLLTLIDPPVVRRPAPPVRFASNDRAAKYAAAVVNGECAEIAAAGSGGRNHRLFQGAARIGELVGAGLVPADLAEAELEAAADACGLTRDDGRHAVAASIKSGLARGAANPREVRL